MSQRAVMALPIIVAAAVAWSLVSRPHPQQVIGPASREAVGSVSRPTSSSSCGVEHQTDFYFGVAPGPNWLLKLSRFDSAGLRPSLVEFYVRFGTPFDASRYCQVTRLGARPFIQIAPRDQRMSAIASGEYDSWLISYAKSVRTFNQPIAFSLAPEMNGSWYSWGAPETEPASYIAAWRHIHKVFAKEHATNVTWTWDVDHCCAARPWWPGTHYVDWVGIDGYVRPNQTFTKIFGDRIAELRGFTRKPILIAEAAVAPGPLQGQQIREVFDGIRRDHLLGLIWFNINAKEPWRIDNNAAALAAVKEAATTAGKKAAQ